MRNLLLYTTLAFITASVISGIFASHFTFAENFSDATLSEARLVLIAMSPVMLMVNFVWLSRTPAKGKISTSLQVAGQTFLFLAPYYWAVNHA